MKIHGDYHTHTIYSHGIGTIEENVEEGIKKGLKEIAICDHGPGHLTYGVKREKLYEMRKEIDFLNQKYKDEGVKILLGVEANLISYDGSIDVDDEIIEILDILLLGYHFGALPKTFGDFYKVYFYNFISKWNKKLEDRIKKMNTIAFIKAMDKYPVDIITHPNAKIRVDIKELSKAAAKANTALEINSHHGELSSENLKIALEEDVKFYINSDAHDPKDVGKVEKGIKIAIGANVRIGRIINVEK